MLASDDMSMLDVPIIDSDTHLSEPPDLWTSRMSSRWGDLVPHLELDERPGEERWVVAGHRLTADGVIVITAARFRTQARNREDARDRLIELIRQAAAPPPPPRRATKPTDGSKFSWTSRKLTPPDHRSLGYSTDAP